MAKKSKSNHNKLLLIFWGLFTLVIISIFMVFLLLVKGVIGYIPRIAELQNPKNKNASEVYSSDGVLLGSYFFQKENRVNTTYNELSPYLVEALIATEDVRYLDHSGVDGKALLRVFFKTVVLQNKNAGGGSTLTQQLAKQLYSPRSKNFVQRALQKPNEWVIAVELEKLYTKEEILTMYLNQFDFLNNAVGIKTAAQVYFNTSPDSLKIEEAAVLVGMCKNPSLYNPLRAPERTESRRNVVLSQMEKAGYITQHEYDSLKVLPMKLDYKKVDHKLGLATYYREFLRQTMMAPEPKKSNYASWQKQKFYEDSLQWKTNPLYGWCNKNTKADGTNYNIYTDGLKIYTTVDSRMQKYAEDAVKEHMTYLQGQFFKEKKDKSYAPFSRHLKQDEVDKLMNNAMKQTERYMSMKRRKATDAQIDSAFNTKTEMTVFSWKDKSGSVDTIMTPMDSIRYHKYFLRCGFMSMDPFTGHVKAYVGGPDYNYFQYDMVTSGKRQVGSTIKPYLYTLAMSNGLTPCDEVANVPITIKLPDGKDWSPRNSSKSRVGEMVTLKWGLTQSNNWISAYLINMFTPQAMVNLMKSMGITSQLDPVVSLCLGPAEISVMEMVAAYTAYPNKGIRVSPVYVSRIEDNNGNVIASFIPEQKEAFDAETSYKMLDMLTAVINQGTGGRLRFRYNLKAPIAGKTGTTQNNSDGWFMGFTPRLVSGCWVGGEDRAIHFDSMAEGQGASMALPIWALYMQKVYADKKLGYKEDERFDFPAKYNSCGNDVPVTTDDEDFFSRQ